ncbi:avenacinase [Cryptococcus neoformans c45]|nr:avenacinase [Cryptococcus neoformans var. grubii c45]
MSLEEKLNVTQQYDQPRVGQVDRLGYTGLFYADGSAGVRGWPFASSFPEGLNAAASFDRDLVYRRASAIGAEARAKGINVQFGPGLNLLRSPQGGRGFEYSGTDPYLAGQIAAEHVKGVQSQNVMATMRHYIGNEQEAGRQITSSNIDGRTAHELYLWPFQDAVNAGVVSTMCSYNGLDGIPACSNPKSLGKWLHEELNYQGWVLSDYGAIYDGYEVDSANAGCDSVIGFTVDRGTGNSTGAYPFGPNSMLSEALANGTVSEARLDDMAIRIISAWFKVGQDQNYPPLEREKNALSDDHNALAREIAAKSIVLLKNENNTLPLRNVSYLYVFGQSASVDLYGFPAPLDFSFAPVNDQGTFASGQGSSYSNLPYLITPFEALQQRARIDHSQVFSYLDNFNHTNQATYAAAANALDSPCLVDVRHQCSEGYDRANLMASSEGDETILAVASACAKTIVIYSACGPFNATRWANHENVTAILNAGGGGQEAGNGLVDVLYGDVNPSARLPYTVAQELIDYPYLVDIAEDSELSAEYHQVNYTEGLLIDYRWFDKYNLTPIYEFGYGLSYTTFKYSNLQVQPSTADLEAVHPSNSSSLYDCLALVQVDIRNDGELAGTEIPQLYLGSPAQDAPSKVLRGFEAVPLGVGETRTLSFNLSRRDLSSWDTATDQWRIPSGSFEVYVGASSRDIRLNGDMTFTLH